MFTLATVEGGTTPRMMAACSHWFADVINFPGVQITPSGDNVNSVVGDNVGKGGVGADVVDCVVKSDKRQREGRLLILSAIVLASS